MKITLIEYIITLCFIFVVFYSIGFVTSGCSSDNSEAIRALENNGFSKITIQNSGYLAEFHGCDSKDQIWYEVSATNPIGKQVNMLVCCGGPISFKGCTVRSK
jgi:hypothetical protein